MTILNITMAIKASCVSASFAQRNTAAYAVAAAAVSKYKNGTEKATTK